MSSIFQLTQTIQIMPSLPRRTGKRSTQQMLPGLEPEAEAQPQITNRQIAEVLSSIADMLEAQASNPYRIQAYRNAARGVLNLKEPVKNFLERGESLPIAGLGDRLRSRIRELAQNGSMTFQNGLCLPALPTGVRALMSVEHVGPYTAIRLYEELEIDSAEKLFRAAQQQRIRPLSGFGIRSEERLKEAARRILDKQTSQPLGGAA
ncbi:helix-hairpin-helix domain-containing protein [Ktedonospora formicarum]|uniref:Crossover junction endonuclease MUS81-like HHH domain-containing protein n=1 Tax=Ktedonospora formicarum TaxID=2778364 RepID=A0A8J3MXJ7_9CHLR|nr:helix-hairpin-helix domain-containing protein [Ktedonospora formicarum]GHO50051.1 hypothetical protein KSX_82140 [Ktedonospora formicarum]